MNRELCSFTWKRQFLGSASIWRCTLAPEHGERHECHNSEGTLIAWHPVTSERIGTNGVELLPEYLKELPE